MKVSCYSQRILNPFRGVMNIIATGEADAVTTDGIQWSLYIHDRFDCRDNEPEEFSNIELPDLRYGVWSEKTGLKRGPVLPSYHYEEIQAIGERLMEAVHQYAAMVPFAFKDDYELWLLDARSLAPLALLDSVCSQIDIHPPDTLKWQAGNRCREYFRSSVLSDSERDLAPADILSRLVNARAGAKPSAQWFHRTDNGYGYGMTAYNLDDEHIGRELSPRLFPRMFVEQQWNKASESALFNEFINWLSPWLLLLDFLKDGQRQAFESSARQQALLVDEMHRLYPKIISEKDINAARVEAALRKSTTTQGNQEQIMHIAYLEI